MELILKTDIAKLGKAGTIIKAKDGYARNFLIPNGLAVAVTPQNVKQLEQEKQKKLQQEEGLKKSAEALKARIAGMSLTMTALVQEEEKLYGSITASDIAAALKDEGLEIDKGLILLNDPIKALGIYEIPLKLHPEVEAKIKVWIVKK